MRGQPALGNERRQTRQGPVLGRGRHLHRALGRRQARRRLESVRPRRRRRLGETAPGAVRSAGLGSRRRALRRVDRAGRGPRPAARCFIGVGNGRRAAAAGPRLSSASDRARRRRRPQRQVSQEDRRRRRGKPQFLAAPRLQGLPAQRRLHDARRLGKVRGACDPRASRHERGHRHRRRRRRLDRQGLRLVRRRPRRRPRRRLFRRRQNLAARPPRRHQVPASAPRLGLDALATHRRPRRRPRRRPPAPLQGRRRLLQLPARVRRAHLEHARRPQQRLAPLHRLRSSAASGGAR
mmetsp:Transcript_10980/g.32947  ORF Transcript_10980/g.32947 Transcript_10980/m.32947 type:complete len:294 (-) Transcript_10980:283-1164(-)